MVKRPPESGEREELLAEVEACYRTFIRGMLDVTDNIVAGETVPPPDVVRYDDDDPYLVVAADKGTATFSDIANSVALEYGYWLGDAFASGRSSGYDHKEMGITAAGAWESVKRHFRELGHNVSSQPFSVVGIGDMSGDVFGNGDTAVSQDPAPRGVQPPRDLLDPNPDPETSWEERKRLFELPRSSWSDYDEELISSGGGVWPRTAKSIELSAEAREALETEASQVTPNELIRALLRGPVDLLWNGASAPTSRPPRDARARGDKANDNVRVNAAVLLLPGGGRGRQPRLHPARANRVLARRRPDQHGRHRQLGGGRLLGPRGEHQDPAGRGGGCRRHDRQAAQRAAGGHDRVRGRPRAQGQLRAVRDTQPGRGAVRVDARGHQRFIRALEHSARLDRKLEALPSEDELAERARDHQGLTRPELSVLLAFSKVFLYAALLDSDVPEDPHLSAELARYFPPQLPERYSEVMRSHRLAQEIVATQVVNNMLHGGGPFAFRLHEETGAPASEIARAYAVAREVFGMRPQWAAIEALDNEVDPEVQLHMLLEGRRLIERGSRWLLRNRRAPMDIRSTVEHFTPGAEVLYRSVTKLLDPDDIEPLARRVDELRAAGVPDDLAARGLAGHDVRDLRRRRGGRGQRAGRGGGGGRSLPARPPATPALAA